MAVHSWERVPLNHVTDKIGSGATPKGGRDSYKSAGVSLIRSLNVHDLEFRHENLAYIDEVQASALANVELKPGDVLLNITGASIARCAVVPVDVLPARVNQHVSILRPRKELLDSDFLAYLLVSGGTKDELLGIGNKAGATRQALTKAQLEAFRVPLPPMDEQKRIVAILDQAFAALDRARAHVEANLADIDELLEVSKTQLLQQAGKLGRSVSFSEVVSIESSLVDPKLPENIDLPHLGAGNMVTNSDALLNVQTAREEKLKSGKHTFEPGMVLYSKIRPYLKKVARPDFAGLCSADVYPLSPSSELDRDFLFHLLLGRDFTDYAISGSDRAGMPKVNRAHLFRYRFNLPPLEVQKEVARKIDAVMATTTKVASHYQAKLADLAQLRQSVLQQAFSGQLT